VATEGGHGSACIDENLALDFVQGRLSTGVVRTVDEHADGCRECRVLLDEAVRSFRDRVTLDLPGGRAFLTVFTRGDVLQGRYRIIRFIARGGMGEVYEAEDQLLGGRLAVKTMNAAISDNQQAIDRLKQEVNLARRITHESVCRIFDIGIHEPSNPRPGERVLFLTMELIEGVSLGERLRLTGPLPATEARPIVEAMGAALGAAHRAGVVHRDFKSDNVMLSTGDGGGAPRVVVMDFGLARDNSPHAATCAHDAGLTGTLAYMAPEQLERKETGPTTDVYALGIVIFEMLTGQLPFQGGSVGDPAGGPMGDVFKRLVESAPPLRSLVAGIDPAWEAVVARCLEREPGRRPASVDEVVRIIGERRSGPVVAEDAPPAPRPKARVSRWMVAAGVAAGALATAAVAAVLALRIGTPPRQPPPRPSPTTTQATMPAAPALAPPATASQDSPAGAGAGDVTVANSPASSRATPTERRARHATGARRAHDEGTRDRRVLGHSGASARGGAGPRANAYTSASASDDGSRRASTSAGERDAAPIPRGPAEAEKPRSLDPEDGFIFPKLIVPR
jgi:tRNA A-37 threonylcarbamoyl transferase component Bud32